MDQAKTNLCDLNVRILEAKCHGRTSKVYAFLITHFTKESNTNLEVLRRVLESEMASRGSLPPKLILQLDNTSQENKNSRMFAFLAMLVERGIFKEIEVNFLPVGHTHEDIDAVFSLISQALKKCAARTMPELIASIQRAVKGAHVEHLTSVVGFWASVKHLWLGLV